MTKRATDTTLGTNLRFVPLKLSKRWLIYSCAATIAMLTGCDSNSSSSDYSAPGADTEPFSLRFKAMSANLPMDCNNMINGYGPDNDYSVGIEDLRFYVSDLTFYDSEGERLAVEMDSNDFQYVSQQGSVALIDLAESGDGTCEGTARTNATITGEVEDNGGSIERVSLSVGVPQALMKSIIATNTEESAPTPLNEMYWNWSSGYRHILFNFTIMSDTGNFGDGLVHVGSTGCGGDGLKALEDKDACDYINTAQEELDGFDPYSHEIVVNLESLLDEVAFANGGVACHSSIENQADCTPIFTNLGIDPLTGNAGADQNQVFSFE